MSGIELLLIAISLAMDAFAVSIGKGLSIQGSCRKECFVTGLYFGVFQSIMPLLGFLCGEGLLHFISPISRVLSFILLVLIGLNMLRETIKESSDADANSASISPKVMFPAAIATSIDAFAVGVTFAAMKVTVWIAILMIGFTAFVLSVVGVKIGNLFGGRLEKQAGMLGGLILVAIGIKILVVG